MASVGTTAAIHRTFASQHFTKKPSTQARIARSLGTTQATNSSVQGPTLPEKQDRSPSLRPEKLEDKFQHFKNSDERSHPRFYDERWKNGTWALDMFVKQGKMDWDAVIVAEARRRKFLELYPEASSNEEPVLFRTSDIPWWAWMVHSHLPEAELLNGRAAMLGFVIAYIVDAVTGLGLVDQTGNFICKGALLFTIIGVLVFRRKEDVENIRKLVGEATLYDKQWQASWQNVGTSEEQIMKND